MCLIFCDFVFYTNARAPVSFFLLVVLLAFFSVIVLLRALFAHLTCGLVCIDTQSNMITINVSLLSKPNNWFDVYFICYSRINCNQNKNHYDIDHCCSNRSCSGCCDSLLRRQLRDVGKPPVACGGLCLGKPISVNGADIVSSDCLKCYSGKLIG